MGLQLQSYLGMPFRVIFSPQNSSQVPQLYARHPGNHEIAKRLVLVTVGANMPTKSVVCEGMRAYQTRLGLLCAHRLVHQLDDPALPHCSQEYDKGICAERAPWRGHATHRSPPANEAGLVPNDPSGVRKELVEKSRGAGEGSYRLITGQAVAMRPAAEPPDERMFFSFEEDASRTSTSWLAKLNCSQPSWLRS